MTANFIVHVFRAKNLKEKTEKTNTYKMFTLSKRSPLYIRKFIKTTIREYLNENKMFHLSNNPNLVIDKNYKPKQGQLGKGFYVTKNINDWGEESIGKRDYIYEIINFDELNIAKPTEQPSRKELVDFGLEMGFYKMGKVIKPNGEIVKDLDGNDMIRPIETDKYKKYATYQDPMTGSSIDFLEQECLKSKGFDGKEPYYSRDGHQIIIWNYDRIKLKRIK